jgi:murein L,D-transpeptidase YafK
MIAQPGVVADGSVCHGLCRAQPAPSRPAAKRYVMRQKNMKTKISVLLLILAASCSSANSNEPNRIANVSSVVVEKSDRELHLMAGAQIIKTYRIALGGTPIGPKQVEGDGKTPEGRYVIDSRNPKSSFYKSLHLSYPSASDIAHAATLGKRLGGDIMIHGIKNGLGWVGRLHRMSDWTQGCIAVTDAEIEEIWVSVADGTPIEIRP